MRCSEWREAASARLDGEDHAGMELADHERTCLACRAWLAESERLTRIYRLAPADAVPDLAGEVLVKTRDLRLARPRLRWLRAALMIVAVTQLIFALPAFAQSGHDAAHVTHEVGAFNLALAVGLLWVALWPHRAVGLLPLMTALVGVLITITVPDILAGHVHWERESVHALLVVALGFLVVLAKSSGSSPPIRDGNVADGGGHHGSSRADQARADAA